MKSQPQLVALDLVPGPRFVNEMQQAWDANDAVLPVDQRLPALAKQKLFETLRPSVVVTDNDRVSRTDGVPVLLGDAVVIATSGTTGTPKGVVLTHDAIRASAVATSNRLHVDKSDKWYACLPLAHIGGLSVVLRSILTQTPITISPRFNADEVNDAVRSGHTRVSLVVATLPRVETTGWKTILLGGSAMPAETADNIVKTYGMTETGSGVVYNGVPLEQVEIEERNGELWIRGPMLLRAYRGYAPETLPAATAGKTYPQGTNNTRAYECTPEGVDPLVNGWFRTGDSGTIDEGIVSVQGRIGDVIVTGGEKVWPDAVERVLAQHPGVRDVTVVPAPDQTWGQRVVAVVVATDAHNPPTLQELRDWVKGELAAYAAPHQLILLNELPRTATGKVQRSLISVDLS
jgi:o-succinylbenzoate---CoA ligase